jgi:hypothetical protein
MSNNIETIIANIAEKMYEEDVDAQQDCIAFLTEQFEPVIAQLAKIDDLQKQVAELTTKHQLPPIPGAAAVVLPPVAAVAGAAPIATSRTLNAWNVFQRLFKTDHAGSAENANIVYQRLYPTPAAKAEYFKNNVVRAMQLDAKNGKAPAVAAVPATTAAAAAGPARAMTNYNAFYAACTQGQEAKEFGKDSATIAAVWKVLGAEEKANWKTVAPQWKVMPQELKNQWIERAKQIKAQATVKA